MIKKISSLYSYIQRGCYIYKLFLLFAMFLCLVKPPLIFGSSSEQDEVHHTSLSRGLYIRKELLDPQEKQQDQQRESISSSPLNSKEIPKSHLQLEIEKKLLKKLLKKKKKIRLPSIPFSSGAYPRHDYFPPEVYYYPLAIFKSPEELPKPYSISFTTSSKDIGTIKNISLFSLRPLEKKYKIPKAKLEESARKLFHIYKQRVKEASKIENTYTIIPYATAFSAIEQSEPEELYDYYDISLNLELEIPNLLKCNYFLPQSFIVRIEPVRYNQESRKWEVIKDDYFKTRIWEHCPHATEGKTITTETNGYTCSAAFTAGAVGPSPTASITATATYASTLSFNRTISHIEIDSNMAKNEAQWTISFNDLHAYGGKGYFSPNGSIPISNLRWLWKVNHEEAKRKLYTDYFIGDKHKPIFYFYIKLFALFAQVAPLKFKTTKTYLPVFDASDRVNQIYGIEVPPPNKNLIFSKVTSPLNA